MSTSTDTPLVPSSIAMTLDRLVAWAAYVEPRLRAQPRFLEVLEEQVGVELRTYFPGPIDPRFVQDMIDAALLRHINQAPVVYDQTLHAPWRWEDLSVQEIPEERRETTAQLVESVGSRLLEHYEDAVRRYWSPTPAGIDAAEDYRLRIDVWLDAHLQAMGDALQPQALAGTDAHGARLLIESLQQAWHEHAVLPALATEAQREAIDRLSRTQLPDWRKQLDDAQSARLTEALQLWRAAEQHAMVLFSPVIDLQAHVCQRLGEALREQYDNEMSPDLIRLRLLRRDATDRPPVELTLSELASRGALDLGQLYQVADISSAVRLGVAPTAEQVQQLLSGADYLAGYPEALRRHGAHPEVHSALLDAADLALKYSALVGAFAGHMTDAQHGRLLEAAAGTGTGIAVNGVRVFEALCADLRVFALSDDEGVPQTWLLHAPGKPDGQEWVVLRSPLQLSEELVGWLREAPGRAYVQAQVPLAERERVAQAIEAVVERPSDWSTEQEHLSPFGDYRQALEHGVQARLQAQLDEVLGNQVPAWYGALALEEQRAINLLRQQASHAEHDFADALGGWQSFQHYARGAIAQAIEPYLRSQGVSEAVDPESIIIDYRPGLADGRAVSVNLVDLVSFGYDDNSGIDHPEHGVRSSVGQDLTALRSADLARYARRAYLGERYAAAMRAQHLQAADHGLKRQTFARALATGMDRDVREALARGHIDRTTCEGLMARVNALAATATLDLPQDTAETVLDTSGLVRLTLDDAPILGVYVFRWMRDDEAQDWLYPPAAPDGVRLRRYADLDRAAGGSLRGYLLARTRLSQHAAVLARLRALAGGSGHRDALRRLNQVSGLANEYDLYIEHALADVEDATASRAEVIRAQVIKGLLLAAPLSMVYPPFALFIGAWFVVAPLREAVIAHSKGDTARALQAWLEVSWGVLGLLAHLPGASLKAVKPVLRDLRPQWLRPRPALSQSIRQSDVRLDRHWAVQRAPQSLHEVGEEGIWAGTWRSTASAGATDAEYFIRQRGRLFKVEYDSAHGTLRVIKGNNPASYHRQAVVLGPQGRWLPNSTGLRGGAPVRDGGRITQPRQITAGAGQPDNRRGALQGEAVVGRLNSTADDNYLFTLNAQTCVAVSLYNPATRAGAVIHFDHNIKPLIEQSVSDVLARLRSQASDRVSAVMAGGDWLGGESIGEPVRTVLRQNGLRPTWEHWSWSSCFGNTYGMTLDLRTGLTRVYTMNGDLVDRVLTPLMRSAQQGASGPLALRARQFMNRVRSEPLVQGSDGVVRNRAGAAVGSARYQAHAIHVVEVGTP
ncbi:hypothetical protein [Pseudomonas sp.]|uniref:hypothetical protein n=1 Tax=Pseudomonas sp. TaxID=306 RepID=UPI0028A9ED6C|nr:hypothetical protein [Pseudomonas sp.]